ncbi:MAG: hypothetical protein AB7F09_26595 [Parvibaculaceae bacterium]
MKTVTVLAATAVLFAFLAPDTGAEAKVRVRIKDRHDNWKLSCNTARHKVRELGYKTVKVKSCLSTVYSFYAVRNGRTHVFYVHSRTGAIWRG